MKKLLIISSVVVLSFSLIILYSFKTRENKQVKGWFLAGNSTEAYQIGTENSTERNGKVAYLKLVKQVEHLGFGTIMQSFSSKDYLGKRVKLTGYIKTKGVSQWTGMWFRVDGENGEMLRFDNMQNRPIKGDTGWKKYEIVLDVPKSSKAISYGVLLSGPGTVWLDDLNFEIVSANVPETAIKTNFDKPQNSNFEDNQQNP